MTVLFPDSPAPNKKGKPTATRKSIEDFTKYKHFPLEHVLHLLIGKPFLELCILFGAIPINEPDLSTVVTHRDSSAPAFCFLLSFAAGWLRSHVVEGDFPFLAGLAVEIWPFGLTEK